MHQFDFMDARHGLFNLISNVYVDGVRVSPRGHGTREIRHVMIDIHRPTSCVSTGMNRGFNARLAAAESLQLLTGVADARWMQSVAPRYLDLTGGQMTGAYGPRIANQMPYILETLRRDSQSRQAVVQIWDASRDLLKAHGDRPCTTHVTFMVRDGQLETTTHMRSQDVFLGFTYDMVMFSMLHQTVASCLGVRPGHQFHVVESLHIYERDIDRALTVTRPPDTPAVILAGLPMHPGDEWDDVQAMAHAIAYESMTEQTMTGMPEPRTVTWLRKHSEEARRATTV